MKPQPNDLANVLRRSVESATQSGQSGFSAAGRYFFIISRFMSSGGLALAGSRPLVLRVYHDQRMRMGTSSRRQPRLRLEASRVCACSPSII